MGCSASAQVTNQYPQSFNSNQHGQFDVNDNFLRPRHGSTGEIISYSFLRPRSPGPHKHGSIGENISSVRQLENQPAYIAESRKQFENQSRIASLREEDEGGRPHKGTRGSLISLDCLNFNQTVEVKDNDVNLKVEAFKMEQPINVEGNRASIGSENYLNPSAQPDALQNSGLMRSSSVSTASSSYYSAGAPLLSSGVPASTSDLRASNSSSARELGRPVVSESVIRPQSMPSSPGPPRMPSQAAAWSGLPIQPAPVRRLPSPRSPATHTGFADDRPL